MPRCAVFVCLAVLLPLQAQQNPNVPTHTDEIVVTGVTTPVPLSESDRSITIEDAASRVPLLSGLQSLLQLDSSVDLKQRAPGVQGDISIRGGSYGQTLVLLNGIRINDAQSSHHNFDVPVPIDAIGHIEILRGSGSTFYGSDAVAGVANVVTRVAEEPELRLRTGYGSFGTNVQSGFFAFSAGRVSQQFSFERELSTGFIQDRDYRNLSGSSQTQIRTRLGTTSILLSALDRPFGADQFYGNYPSWERTKTWFSALHQDLGPRTTFDFSYRRHTDLYVLVRSDPSLYTNRHEDESWYTALRRHDRLHKMLTLAYGADLFADSVDSTNLGMHSRTRGSAYAVLGIQPATRLSLSLGAREEFFGAGRRFFAPTASAGYWLSSRAKVRGSVTRAFRLPNYTDLYYHDPSNLGNPLLLPERATSYEGGIDLYPTSKIRVAITGFQRREKDNIDYVRSSVDSVWTAVNFQSLNYTGVEAAIEDEYRHGQKIGATYTGLHGVQGSLNGMQAKYQFSYPIHQGIVQWQGLYNSGLLARMRLGVTERYQQAPYTVWDAYVAMTRYRIRPYLQATNLLNMSYQEIIGVRVPGRAFLVGMEFQVWRGRK